MKADNTILTKLQKILALADKGTTEAEMATALAKAQELAQQHNIDISEVRALAKAAGEQPKGIETETAYVHARAKKSRRPQHRYILMVLTECFGVQCVYFGSTPHFALIGEKTDVAMARVIFAWLDRLFPSLLTQYINRIGAASYAGIDISYYTGLAQGLIRANSRANEDRRKAMASDLAQEYALVLVDKAKAIEQRMMDEFPRLKVHKLPYADNQRAAAAGFHEGESIKFGQHLTS